MTKNKKKNLASNGFCRLSGAQIKMKENQNIDKYLDLARELKKSVEREDDSDTNCS